MTSSIDFLKLRTSWTKYDIVRVMEVVYNLDTTYKFKNKEVIIDEPILRSFLGISSLEDPLPKYWVEIQNYPAEKSLFALLAVIFTHGEIVHEFATKYSNSEMGGLFRIEPGKQYTNIRSALIESGAAEPVYRRTEVVPYNFSLILKNGDVGKLFKEVLIERVSRLSKGQLSDSSFYDVCFFNNFHNALSLTKEQFKEWLEGNVRIEKTQNTSLWIEEVEISNFYSVEEAVLDFNGSKEIYFLGENGDGKSLILMAIYLAFNGRYITENTDLEQTGKIVDILRANKKLHLLGIDSNSKEYSMHNINYLQNIFAYGTHRGRYSTDNPEEYGFMTLFDSDKTLTNPVSWLKDQKLLELEKRQDASNIFSEEKNLPNSVPITTLETLLFDLLEKNVEIKVSGEGVLFKEKGTYLSFDQLSEGYKSILIFVSDLLYRLSKNAKPGQSITDLKATVLVDEIDLHLHPKWQRVIICKLRKIFPQVQFIFTTHSPTIIQGASDDALIYRVYRNTEDGKTRISDPYPRKDLDHLMINSLVTSPLFGLEDARMDTNDENSDTSDTYLLYRINEKIKIELEMQKSNGKSFISDDEIDHLIQGLLEKELGKDDKN